MVIKIRICVIIPVPASYDIAFHVLLLTTLMSGEFTNEGFKFRLHYMHTLQRRKITVFINTVIHVD
jgi:hypothetical protein